MAIELGLTCDGRWQAGPQQLIALGSAAGFTALGLSGPLIDSDTPALLRAAGMRCHEVMALTVSNNEQATLAAAERMAAKAALIGAPWVVTVFTATMDQAAMARVKRCAAIFQEAGSRMAVEFSPLGTVGTIREGLEIVGAVGSDQSGVLIDSWHFFHGESTWADLEEVPLDRIAYIQFSDALACISDDAMDETMNRRAMPGMGTLDLDRFATILLERQWEGVVSVEVLSRDSADFPTVEFAQTAYDLTARYWI